MNVNNVSKSGTFNPKDGNLKSTFPSYKLVYWDHENVQIQRIGQTLLNDFIDYVKDSSTKYSFKVFITPRGTTGQMLEVYKNWLVKKDVELHEHSPNGKKELLDKYITFHLAFDCGSCRNCLTEVYLITQDGDFVEACGEVISNRIKVNVLYVSDNSTSTKILNSVDISSYKFSKSFLGQHKIDKAILYSRSMTLLKINKNKKDQIIFQFHDNFFMEEPEPLKYSEEKYIAIRFVLSILYELNHCHNFSKLGRIRDYDGAHFCCENNSNFNCRDMEQWSNLVLTLIDHREETITITGKMVKKYIDAFYDHDCDFFYSARVLWKKKFKLTEFVLRYTTINCHATVPSMSEQFQTMKEEEHPALGKPEFGLGTTKP